MTAMSPGPPDRRDHGPAVVAILLAAGASRRFASATSKLTATLRGRPVYAWALDQALAASIGPVLVVTGATSLDLPGDVVEVPNPEWGNGQMSSLRAGLAAAASRGADAAVIGLADQPFVTASAWRAVASQASVIAVATYAGLRGNPVRLHHSVWDQLPPDGDEGARALMRRRPDLVGEVPCDGSPADIDTVEDLARWSSPTNSP